MWTLQNNMPKERLPYMNTITSLVNKVVKDGFSDSFQVTDRGLYSFGKSRYYRPEQVSVVNLYRSEEASAPYNNSVMYVIETADGIRGTLIDNTGAYGDSKVTGFMQEVEDIHKKVEQQDKRLY